MVIFLLPEIQKQKGKWVELQFSFVPEYTARSYNLEPNGSDTLHHIRNKWFSYKLRQLVSKKYLH